MKKCLLLLFVGVCSLLVFNACSSDNEPSPSSSEGIKSALVGVWKTSINSSDWKTIYVMPNSKLKYGYVTKEELKKYTYSNENGHYYYILTSDDNFTYVEEYDPAPNGHWVYDPSTQTVSMYSDDSKKGNMNCTFKVMMSDDGKSWAGVNSKGETVSFIKIEE